MRVLSAFLFSLSRPSHALALLTRRDPAPTAGQSLQDSPSSSRSSLALALGLSLALVAALVLVVGGTAMSSSSSGRRRVRDFFRKHFLWSEQQQGQQGQDASTRTPAAPSRRPPLTHASASSYSTNRPATPTPRSHHPPSGVTVADRPITSPRPERHQHRRRRRRRTQSPVGLPLYSPEPGEEEMSLFKSQDMFESQLDLSLSRATTAERSFEEGEGEGEDDESEQEEEDDREDDGYGFGERRIERASAEVSQSSSVQGHAAQNRLLGSGDGLLQPPPTVVRGRPRSASEPLGPPRIYSTTTAGTRASLSPYLSHSPSSGSSSPFASRSGLIDVPPRPPSPPPPLSLTRSARPSGYFATHRSSRSSPINTLNPPSPASSIRNLHQNRPRASTLQRLLGSNANANASSSSLASASGAGAGAGTSPYGEGGVARLASQSTVSVRTKEISPPLPGSFVHSSFVFPRSGPTPQQVAFISSRESLGAYGYGTGVAPPHHPASPTRADGDGNAPPAFAAVDEGLRRLALGGGGGGGGAEGEGSAVRGRGRSGSEASWRSQRSPLGFEVELPSPRLDEPADLAIPAPDAQPDHPSELASASASPDIPPSAPPALDLSQVQSTRPHPPDIVTLAPTPTASAAPSPRLPPPLSFASTIDHFFDFAPEPASHESPALDAPALSKTSA